MNTSLVTIFTMGPFEDPVGRAFQTKLISCISEGEEGSCEVRCAGEEDGWEINETYKEALEMWVNNLTALHQEGVQQ